MRTGTIISLLLFLLPACTSLPNPSTESPPSPLIIGRIETRHQLIEITSTSDGVRYTLKSKTGQLLLANLTFADLQARSPATANLLQTGISWAGE